MNQAPPTIVLTGGGSGGHITPLLSLARELKRQSPDCQILYIGQKGDIFDTLKQSGHDFDFMAFIKAGKFRRYHGQSLLGLLSPQTVALNVRDFFRLPGSIASSYKILRKFKPDAVFSKGGFVALPVGVAAHLLKIPIITHDSDSTPGLANRSVGRWAKLHATGMPAEYYKYPQSRVAYVGIPMDEAITKVTPRLQAAAKDQLKLPKDSHMVLLSGGGNGSKTLNDLMVAVAPELLKTNLGLRIVHISGLAHEKDVKAAYASLPKAESQRLIVAGYLKNFTVYAAAADIVITRAGATTLAELAAAGKACIVIPAPFLAGGHQIKNAEQLANHDAVVMLADDVQPDEFLATINSLLSNDSRRFELARNLFAQAKPDAAKQLAKIIIQTATRQT